MNGYLLCVIGTVMLSALLTAITPEGKSSSVIKGVCRLICVLAIVAPVLKFLQSDESKSNEKIFETFFIQSGIDMDENVIQYYSELKIQEAEKRIEEEMKEDFALSVNIDLHWQKEESDQIKITCIYVKIQEEYEQEVAEKMWEYLTKNYCSEVLIE